MKEIRNILQNREGRKIVALINENPSKKWLVFIMHGLGGSKEEKHIIAFSEVFFEKWFTVVRFDTTNTLGESDGKYEDATLTNYYHDLEDVLSWARNESWYQGPFVLCGHSLGGISIALYAERYPDGVLAIAPISTVVSGELSLQTHKKNKPEDIIAWEASWWRITESKSKPGVIKRLPWSHMMDRLNYDLIPEAHRLTMPVLLITGEGDLSTPPEDVRVLFEVLPWPKAFHIIKNAPHTFCDPMHLLEIKHIFGGWIDTLSST